MARTLPRRLLLAALTALACCVLAQPAGATLPGRNGLIAYPAADGIRAITAAGSGDRLLASARGARRPAWSADGRRLAFSANPDGSADGREIFVTSLASRRTRALTSNTRMDDSPTWSSNGHLMAYVAQVDGYQGLYVVALGVNRSRLIATADFITDVEWSPDRATLAYAADGDVHVTDAQGRSHRRVARFGPERAATTLSWSPDGRRLALGVAVSGRCQDCDSIWRVGRDGGGLKRLTPQSPQGDSDPFWSPDGRMIAYCHTDFSPENFGARVLNVMNASGGDARKLSDRGCGGDWQPLGRRANRGR